MSYEKNGLYINETIYNRNSPHLLNMTILFLITTLSHQKYEQYITFKKVKTFTRKNTIRFKY